MKVALLAQPYAEVGRDEAVALARGLDLGLLLAKFPEFPHYQPGGARCPATIMRPDLDGLLGRGWGASEPYSLRRLKGIQ